MTIQIRRTSTPGAAPSSLQPGQLAINDADGVLFFRTSAGAIQPFSLRGGSGTAIVDFGSPGTGNAQVAITGQAGITAGSEVDAWIVAVATADHSADEHIVENIRIRAGAIVPGIGFTIYAFAPEPPVTGRWSVHYSWSN